jgi:hypothetical protein
MLCSQEVLYKGATVKEYMMAIETEPDQWMLYPPLPGNEDVFNGEAAEFFNKVDTDGWVVRLDLDQGPGDGRTFVFVRDIAA